MPELGIVNLDLFKTQVFYKCSVTTILLSMLGNHLSPFLLLMFL